MSYPSNKKNIFLCYLTSLIHNFIHDLKLFLNKLLQFFNYHNKGSKGSRKFELLDIVN